MLTAQIKKSVFELEAPSFDTVEARRGFLVVGFVDGPLPAMSPFPDAAAA